LATPAWSVSIGVAASFLTSTYSN